MPALTPPPSLSLCAPFLARADEITKTQPVVAYFCRTYAAEVCVPKMGEDPEARAFLKDLLTRLEADKSALGSELPAKAEAQVLVEAFALQIFLNADTAERAGTRDARVAKAFYAAAIFFETLHQFGEVDEDILEKQKYAKVKAAEISKEIKEGKKNAQAGGGGDATNNNNNNNNNNNATSNNATNNSNSNTVANNNNNNDSSAVAAAATTNNNSNPPASAPQSSYQQPQQSRPPAMAMTSPVVSKDADPIPISKAQKHAKWAVSALQYYDVPTAVEQLEQALAILKSM